MRACIVPSRLFTEHGWNMSTMIWCGSASDTFRRVKAASAHLRRAQVALRNRLSEHAAMQERIRIEGRDKFVTIIEEHK